VSPRRRGWSDITVTDQFCGAGGSSIGAHSQGLRIRMAMNHWKLAVETHNTNFPDTDHDTCDISAADPRRYPSTDILITSPECTTHSPAGGNRRSQPQRDFFIPRQEDDAATTRSRATMRDVPRFAEYHKYRRIIVENVVEVTRWPLFHHWLKEMEILGYQWQLVSLNSMHCWPTPQSRDRLYICFWRKGDPAPDMRITPKAPCHRCERVVDGVQTWKAGALKRAIGGQPLGKYRTQYVYTCPVCRSEVTPFYYAALNAIDFSLAAQRIGDRSEGRQLKPRTLERIRYGLEKYGHRELIIRTNMTSGLETRVRGLEDPHFTQTASWLDGLFSPLLVETAYSHSDSRRVRRVDEPVPTASARNSIGVLSPFVVPIQGNARAKALHDPLPSQLAECPHEMLIQGAPFIAAMRGTDESQRGSWAIPSDQPIGTVSAGGIHHALIGPGFAPFLSIQREHNVPHGLDEAASPVCTGGHHMLVQGAAQLSMRDTKAMRVAGLDEEMRTQGAGPQAALLSLAPFIVSHYGTNNSSSIDAPVPSVTTIDRHELVSPQKELRVEDCYFRMLQPHEIGRAMAFPTSYEVLGNKRDRVKQYGNAVTPPAMATLIERQVQAMTGDRAA
jgi:DNA (cytosine-5)-methyltransferase 1